MLTWENDFDEGDEDDFEFAEQWGVWCRVSGGMTGDREAWLKEDGKIWTGTEEEAVEKARALHKKMNEGPRHSLACFRYTAERYC